MVTYVLLGRGVALQRMVDAGGLCFSAVANKLSRDITCFGVYLKLLYWTGRLSKAYWTVWQLLYNSKLITILLEETGRVKGTAQGMCSSKRDIFFRETQGLPSISAKPCLKCLNCLLTFVNSGTIGVAPSTRFPAEVLSAFSSLWPTWECRASLASGKCPTQARQMGKYILPV